MVAVQRGDPEMEQKLNRIIRGCLESEKNPILSIHDQGAGGNGENLEIKYLFIKLCQQTFWQRKPSKVFINCA